MTLKWEEGNLIVNYSKAFVNNNLWRITSLGYDKEDFLQECFIVYNNCVNKFVGEPNDALFFSYFKQCLKNATNNLSIKSDNERKAMEIFKEGVATEGNAEEEALFTLKLHEAPLDIKKFIRKAMYGDTRQGIMYEKTKNYFLQEV